MKTLITVVSDLHVGSSTGLCPVDGLELDDGGMYIPSKAQLEVARVWEKFFLDGKALKGIKKRVLVVNGDTVDGFHHNTVALATNNVEVQEKGAIKLLGGISKYYDRVFMTRGTEAHVQQSGMSEERVAKAVGAEADEAGNHASWQLWMDVQGVIFNIAHHIGTTSSAAYESSAVMREMVAALVEAGQWRQQLPSVIVRSHRHRYIKVGIPSESGDIEAVVTPGWQLRTPFVEKIDRMRLPHIGGINCIVRMVYAQ
jgi:hypothetical protein